MAIKRLHIIRLFAFLLLLMTGSTTNKAWADVTYIILTKPFNVRNYQNNANFRTGVRVEALRCTSDGTTVYLPDAFRSPLATNFKYYTSATSTYESLYDTGHGTWILATKYDIYTAVSSEVTENSAVGANTTFYVTYDYINDSHDPGWRNGIIELDGTKNYTVTLNKGNNLKYLCYNRSRNNRPAAANASTKDKSGNELFTGERLISDKFEYYGDMSPGFKWDSYGPRDLYFQFKFEGTDPYNVVIKTAYIGEETYNEYLAKEGSSATYKKPYQDAAIFSKINNNSATDKLATEEKMWLAVDHNVHYKSKTEISVDQWPGFYRGDLDPVFNAYAILPHNSGDGYVFMASKMNVNGKNHQPNGDGNYVYLMDNNYNPSMYFKAANKTVTTHIYEIREYTFKVKTHGSGAVITTTMKWTDAKASENILNHIPEAIKRKYVNFTGAYKDDELGEKADNSITTFADANSNGNVIWLDYSVSTNLPFETLPLDGNYQDARWYTMRINGSTEAKNIAYHESNNLITADGSGNAKGSNTPADLHQGENSAEAMVAFLGDPFELKIISRKACEAVSENRYIGCAMGAGTSTTLNTNETGSSDISTWEIVYESTNAGNFILREFNTVDNPKYIGWNDAATNKPVVYSTATYTDKNRIRVVPMEEVDYNYHIVRNDGGDIAVKASSRHDLGKMLRSWEDIPEIIRSPFIAPTYTATVTYYASLADAKEKTNAITNAPYDSNRDIYVRYSYVTPLVERNYNVILNSNYIYTSSDNTIYSKVSITDLEREQNPYIWALDYSDPYHMKIKNIGKDKYINVDFSDDATIDWSSDTPSYFVAKSGSLANTFEVMAATGESVDASTTYYNIGRPAANTVKLYSNSTYLHGNQILRFQLIGTSALEVTYHLIDKDGKDLLKAVIRQTSEESPAFPPEYHSPLVSTYHYYLESNFTETDGTYTLNSPTPSEVATIGSHQTIFVTYDVNDLVNLKRGKLYRLKFEAGETFHQEDGSDGVNSEAQQAIYPYVNGDCNFFVYGEEQYEIQKESASTRTRWVWYLQSDLGDKGDPYHVKIRSYQTESYPITNPSDYNAFFATFKPEGYSEVVTTLVWPGISGETETEYMVLGSQGQYQLVTTYKVDVNGDGDTNDAEDERKVVDSFEQYWKTYDTIRRKLLKQTKNDYPDKDEDPTTVPATPCLVTGFDNNRTYLTTSPSASPAGMGFHSYEKWAYAKRWNGYNNGYSSTEGKHETKKGWEKIEHWYQTISMGQGYFDFVETSIDPVLILLDQHGWEIMRKPLPSSPDDPEKNAKYEAIRTYNSPMVKEYAFWATSKKRTGFHQYYLLSDRIGGDDFTSTDLTNLPPYDSKNVKDKRGNLNDQYVTYIVKDEYAQSYNPDGNAALPFLIEQGTDYKYATTNAAGTTLTASDIPHSGDMKAHIINDEIPTTEQWYVRPNADIDIEMGYNDATHNWDAKTPNAYEDSKYNKLRTSVYVKKTTEYKDADAATQKALTDKYGEFSFSNGFDPYNIQISPVGNTAQFMKTNATKAVLENGDFSGSYPVDPGPTISMGATTPTMSPAAKWYDSRNLAITNTTFMAVQDAEGNMQLMPRFDHDYLMSEFSILVEPTDANVESTYTKLYRPVVYNYLIIDNSGKESLRYKSGGDLLPQTPEHFKSPFAKNYEYYATATETSGTYTNITNKIEESLDGATLTDNTVYVRYSYDEDVDVYKVLQGKWFSMQLNEMDAKYDGGIKQGTGKPTTIDGSQKAWQWKFLETPQTVPDPYAVYIYNRSQTEGTEAIDDRFALLSHSAGDYALAKAGRGDDTYQFLNGNSMDESTAAVVATESDFTATSGTFDGTQSQVKLADEVQHAYTYKVYTNNGVLAIEANQGQEVVIGNDWKPELPETAQTPLLNIDQYRYYEHTLAGTIAENDTLNKSLSLLYGLYDDIVYTHYTPYNDQKSSYVVPNVRNATNIDPVARGSSSKDAPLGLDGKRPYNIIWLDDNMMKSNGTSITCTANQELQANTAYEWELEGDDPYAIKIKSVGETGKYVHEATSTTTELSITPTTFMILEKEGYDYGVLAKTGDVNTMLSGYGNSLTTGDPTKFIIFALSTFKVIYHLMIKNIGSDIIIPYRETVGGTYYPGYKIKSGTTMRDLTTRDETAGHRIDGDKYQLGGSLPAIINLIDAGITTGLVLRDSIYCLDAGHVSLGDKLEVPSEFYRPNVAYDFYVEGIYDNRGEAEIGDLNKYKGVKVTRMGEDSGLLGKIVFINIVYNFMGGLDTNSGSDFVESVAQNKWYTFEANASTPKLAQYTGSLQTVSGYATHYTNDYLWTPVGDPYGFKMYNRYMYKNLGNETTVMTTTNFADNQAIEMRSDNAANSVYELLATNTTTPGYFRVHPVVNNSIVQYYMRDDDGTMKLSLTPTEWTFGLSEDVMSPYYVGAGYVGGLNTAGKEAYDEAAAKTNPLERLMSIQDVVYNHDKADNNPENYIVHFTPGYYRLHSQPGSSGISTPRYASGYIHEIEKTAVSGGIPMHFYEQTSYAVDDPDFTDLGSGFTVTNATRGNLPLSTVTYDPASIFYISSGSGSAPYTMQTQGLYVKENKMTETAGEATSFNITDIGGAIVALSGTGPTYLRYDQSDANHIYDLTYSSVGDESARWCMKPVQKTATAGNGEMELRVSTHNGGDGYYYTTFCAPYDVLLTDATKDFAYVIPPGEWPTITPPETDGTMHPKKIGQYNTAENGCPEDYRNNNQFIPAGTPVIIRTKSTIGYVTLALPTTTPSNPVSCLFSGKYLEQMLPHGSDYVYAFGLPYTGTFTEDANFATNGIITASAPAADKGVGFYKNANFYHEGKEFKPWDRNNKYVYANKIYYRAGSSGASARGMTRSSVEFIPVIFDDLFVETEEYGREQQEDEEVTERREYVGDGCVYDMQGRRVATEEQVIDGTWKQRVSPGIYIINGKKISVN